MPDLVESLRNIKGNRASFTLSIWHSADVIRHIRKKIASGARMPDAILHVSQKLVTFEKLDQCLVDQRFEDFACYLEKTDWTAAGWLR